MDVHRRRFLSLAAAPIVYQLVGPAPQLKAAGPNDEVRLGFIGVGIRGTILLESFLEIPGVRPVIAADVYDGHLTRAKELTNGSIITTRDYRAVLERNDVDAVVIATPDHWHLKMTLDTLAAGKHAYVEKPMTWSIEEGSKIIQAEKKSGLLVQVGSGGQSSALTAKARELITTGALGKVNMVRMGRNRNSPGGAWVYPIPEDASPKTIDWNRFLGSAPKRPFDPAVFFRWRCWWEYSGGVATDLFVHMLTQMHEFMDVKGPESAVSQGGIYRWNDGRTVPDVLNSTLKYEQGFLVDMYVNLGNSRTPHGTTVMGTDATLAVTGRDELILYPEPVEMEVQPYAVRSWPEAAKEKYLRPAAIEDQNRPQAKPAKQLKIERGLSHTGHFIRSIREGKPSVQDAGKGHYAAGAAHLANLAYREGRRKKWDLRTGDVSDG